MADKRKLLIFSKEPVTRDPKGAGIRYFNFAEQLASDCEVYLLVPEAARTAGSGVRIVNYNLPNVRKYLKEADICIYDNSRFFYLYPLLAGYKGKLIVDLWPSIFEDRLTLPRFAYLRQELKYRRLYSLGDEFLAFSDPGRNYFKGKVRGGRVTTITFGLSGKFRHEKTVLNGSDKDDKVIIMYGRLSDWYDPVTLVKAFKLALKKNNKLKLVFLGAGGWTCSSVINLGES